MKCSKCNSGMEEGFFNAGVWFKGKRSKSIDGLNKILMQYHEYVIAFRCTKCRKIELYSEGNN
jgi:hypothetical protein